ncbi:MAG: hypothetical protein WDA16_03735 [Candidatus Thermoplasmatota archaeon]
MTTEAQETISASTAQLVTGTVEGRGLTKVYWASSEKEAFVLEARSHGQRESEYARFILTARKDPMLFLQLCRLRDATFAHGLMGNPAEAGKVAEIEKRLSEATHEVDSLLRDRQDLEKRNEALERSLADAVDRARDLAGQVVDLARIQDAARERAVAGGAEYESTAKPFLAVVQALRIAGRMTKKELEASLVEAKYSQADASQAVQQASRLGLVVKGADARLRLAKPAVESEEE